MHNAKVAMVMMVMVMIVVLVMMMPMPVVDDDMLRHGRHRRKSDSRNQRDRRDQFLQHQASPYGYVNRANPVSPQVNIEGAGLTATEYEFRAGHAKVCPAAGALRFRPFPSLARMLCGRKIERGQR
jgi:hypothetical protein